MFESPDIKVGDLIRWSNYKEEQYVPKHEYLIGVVLKIEKWEAWTHWTISVLANTGERIILYPQHTKIEVINEDR